jgi:N-acetylglucosaminyldiphosphoundecaprenol N-acetyl-beta-D-mannosaminyltransferase
VNYMGCPLDTYTFRGAVEEIVRRVRHRGPPSLVHFLNVAKIVKAHASPELETILWDGDLVLADGKPLQYFGRGLRIRVPERIAGIDLMLELLEVSSRETIPVYLLGAKEEVLQACLRTIERRFPGIQIAGSRNGYFSPQETPVVIEEINRSCPGILFVGMGTPQKELFAFENRARLMVPVVQGAGGTFDVIAGVTRRAPSWMQELGLEWLFRVLQEPRRLFWRYFSTNLLFLVLFLKTFLRRAELQRPRRPA